MARQRRSLMSGRTVLALFIAAGIPEVATATSVKPDERHAEDQRFDRRLEAAASDEQRPRLNAED
jgi:hypothetical protein